MNNKERFKSLCGCIHREGIEDLMVWLETCDFYTAPASTRFHGAYPGGLLQHSLNVYDELVRILKAYPEIQCSDESRVICALFHDFCKIDFYANEKRNRKNEHGQWETYDSYKVDENFCFGGHGSKSVFLIERYIRLSPEEAVAINCHMSAWQNPDVGKSFEQFPLAWALSVADQAATYLLD